MKILKLIFYDLKQGTKYNNYRWLLPVVLGILGPLMFIQMYDLVYGGHENATLLECAMYLYRGAKYITPEQLSSMYTLPALWLGVQIVIGFLVGYYPVDDIHTYGQQVLIRSRKRVDWWISKCVWNVATVVMSYAIIDLVILVMCVIFGMDIKLTFSDDVFVSAVLEMHSCTGTLKQVIIFTFIMPVVVSVAVSLMQMTLSMIISPMVGFILVETLALFATMLTNPVFIHNYGMLAHSIIASPTNIKYSTGCVVCLLIAVVSVVVGAVYFEKYNVLAKE